MPALIRLAQRQLQRKPCSALLAIGRGDASSRAFDNGARDGKAEAAMTMIVMIGAVMVGFVVIDRPGAGRILCVAIAPAVRREAGGKDRLLSLGRNARAVVFDGKEKTCSSALAIRTFGRLSGHPIRRLFAQANLAQANVDSIRRRAWPRPNS